MRTHVDVAKAFLKGSPCIPIHVAAREQSIRIVGVAIDRRHAVPEGRFEMDGWEVTSLGLSTLRNAIEELRLLAAAGWRTTSQLEEVVDAAHDACRPFVEWWDATILTSKPEYAASLHEILRSEICRDILCVASIVGYMRELRPDVTGSPELAANWLDVNRILNEGDDVDFGRSPQWIARYGRGGFTAGIESYFGGLEQHLELTSQNSLDRLNKQIGVVPAYDRRVPLKAQRPTHPAAAGDDQLTPEHTSKVVNIKRA